MTDRPIIFSPPMVRALLAGRKTQTRRITDLKGLRWAVGDRLWVRERGWIAKSKMAFEPFVGNMVDAAPCSPDGTPYKVCPSIHMPRWASRLTLMVTAVRVERLQDISKKDAEAEGVERIDDPRGVCWKSYETLADGSPHPHAIAPNLNPVTSFREIWNSINGPNSWDENPWVAAISFDVVKTNIDQMDEAA